MEIICAILPIDDGEAAKKFYVDGLGFTVEFEARHEPGFPAHIGIRSGDLFMHISEHGKGQEPGEVYVFVDDIEAWHQRCLKNNVPVSQPPEKRPWGNTEMNLNDPYGNLLHVTQIGTHEIGDQYR
ncbi:MAG: VOC family protein [Marinicaulis sp.]|nr:VOC family protein [Marinicaulis sp.]